MAMVCDADRCARAHLNGNAASANYYIGNDGRICGGVSEDRRAWTSGSSYNDQRAITIEVSNSATGEPWPVSAAAYGACIKLCADICQRYGIEHTFRPTETAH
jgi:N-acetyl-anhydromuramyl-L-alanine amidase AmpD